MCFILSFSWNKLNFFYGCAGWSKGFAKPLSLAQLCGPEATRLQRSCGAVARSGWPESMRGISRGDRARGGRSRFPGSLARTDRGGAPGRCVVHLGIVLPALEFAPPLRFWAGFMLCPQTACSRVAHLPRRPRRAWGYVPVLLSMGGVGTEPPAKSHGRIAEHPNSTRASFVPWVSVPPRGTSLAQDWASVTGDASTCSEGRSHREALWKEVSATWPSAQPSPPPCPSAGRRWMTVGESSLPDTPRAAGAGSTARRGTKGSVARRGGRGTPPGSGGEC